MTLRQSRRVSSDDDLKVIGQEMQHLIHQLRIVRTKLPAGLIRDRVEKSLSNAAHVFNTARATVQIGEQVDDFMKYKFGLSAMQMLDMIGVIPGKAEIKKVSPVVVRVLQSVNRDLKYSLLEAQLEGEKNDK